MLADFLQLLLRRWRLSTTFVVLAIGAAAVVLVLIPPVQESEAAVLFIPPNRDATVDGTVNPFLSLGGSLGVVPSVIQSTVTDERTARKLVAAGHDADYTVVVDVGQNAAPILRVTADSRSVATSVSTVQAVVTEIQAQLLALQTTRAVDTRYYITATVLTSTPEPLVVRTGQIQAGALAAIGVLALGVGLIGVSSRPWARPRHRRAADRPDADIQDEPRTPGYPGLGADGTWNPANEPDPESWSATTTHHPAAIDPAALPVIGTPLVAPGRAGWDTLAELRPTEHDRLPVAPSTRRPARSTLTPRRRFARTRLAVPDLRAGGTASGRGPHDGDT